MTEEIIPDWLDPFAPDLEQPGRRIFCLHCDGAFRMGQVIYGVRFGGIEPLWWCPNKCCDGAGVGHDLFTEPWWCDEAVV